MLLSRMSYAGLPLLLLLLAGGYKQAYATDDCICTAQYDPVCGKDGKTYSNACQAGCANVEVASSGECTSIAAAPGCKCGDEVKPVCGKDGHSYKSACEAKCAGTGIKYTGPCGVKDSSCKRKCKDTRGVWDPVCLVSGGVKQKPITYANPCYAQCKGKAPKASMDFYKGSCSSACTAKCETFAGGKPVCCGKGVEFPNACYAACAGGLSAQDVGNCTSAPCKGDQAAALLMPGDNLCPAGSAVTMCFRDPCQGETCPVAPKAQCIANYCAHKWFRLEKEMGPCEAVWLDPTTGHLVTNCTAT